jgi:hypothetical protein
MVAGPGAGWPAHREFQEAIMTEYKSDLLRLLSERGHIHQLTDAEGLDALAQKDCRGL